ncbi:BNR/Asp-box repeat protein [Devosia equisanguinis]|uniref:BNR/Asp-box repeat protein n=1 Tax=Devosia equisanguinis TaxID=2490941 RepID=A0A3S4C9A6_9HYPH|nr:sialidase family protein [Devosia equisanguinis]VDS03057.1 BNR/Asp-box repeat protein [Devosia equisanguinis]
MQFLETGILYANPDPLLVSRQAAFPGLARLASGDIVALFSIGQAFDAADMRAHVSRSTDNGRTWSAPSPLHTRAFTPEESETFKPVALADGTLLATGYVFLRPTSLTPIVDPKTNELLPLHNKLSRSHDGGHTWTAPERFIVEDAGLELSGPIVQRASGELLGSGAPFHLGPDNHEGWLISSVDNGKTWQKKSIFFRAEPSIIAPWESRLIDFGGERIGVLFWAFDIAAGHNLTNRLALSEDGGDTFRTLDTGIHAQASNGLALGDSEMFSIHAHRESPVGLNICRSRLHHDRLEVLDTLALFADERLGQGTGEADPFANLRFGQPSLLALGRDEYLACCWQVEHGQHVIKTFRIRL